jgi:hypothetical protein
MEPRIQGERSDQEEPVYAGKAPGRGGRGREIGQSEIETDDPTTESARSREHRGEERPHQETTTAPSQVRETSEGRSHTRDMANVADSATDDDQERAGDRAEGGGQSKRPGREQHQERARKEGEQRGKGDVSGRDKEGSEAGDRGRPAQPPSMVRIALFSGLVALVCGAIGGWAYSSFFSSTKEDRRKSPDKHTAANEPSDSSTKTREAESSKESGGRSESGDEASSPTRLGEPDTLRKQIEDLAKRVDSLDDRFDSLTLPRDQTPPEIRKLQVKVIDLAHAVERMDDRPKQFRHIEDRVEEMQRQLKALESQITGRQEDARGSTAPSAKPQAAPSADIPSGGVTTAPKSEQDRG